MATTTASKTHQPVRRFRLLAVLAALMMAASACGSDAVQSAAGAPDGPEYGDSLAEFSKAIGTDVEAVPEDVDISDFESLTWDDLVPEGFSSDEIWSRYEGRLAMVEDGSPEANAIFEEMQSEYDSGTTNTTLDGKQIQLSGFVAPLSYKGDIVTEFLLVPYFGACIHVPPPPPNQTIMVNIDEAEGLTVDETWGAVWVAGTLTATSAETDLANAGYTLSGVLSGVYDDY